MILGRLTSEEIQRKLLHVGVALLPLGIFYLPHWHMIDRKGMLLLLGGLLGGSLIVETLRLRHAGTQTLFFRYFGSMLRSGERQHFTGSTWLFGSSFFCALLLPAPIAAVVMSTFIMGDAAAAVVGLSIGRIRLGSKSLEGSLGCLICSWALLYWVYPLFPGLLDSFGGHFTMLTVCASALCLTVLELLPLRINKSITINDNLAVPLITGALMVWLQRIPGAS